MKLNVCQPCLQIQQMIVDHCCSGDHASHLNLCKKKIGAVACPYQLSQSPSQKMTANQPEVRLLSPSTSPVTYSLEHSQSMFVLVSHALTSSGKSKTILTTVVSQSGVT